MRASSGRISSSIALNDVKKYTFDLSGLLHRVLCTSIRGPDKERYPRLLHFP
jgi:hypothetical protein